ncbi:cadmium-translocating P-type ATPase [Patescibacteria group bacterium]|nr:cadmium-translocating P-type ATPase [Patescibacteria group bacterium]
MGSVLTGVALLGLLVGVYADWTGMSPLLVTLGYVVSYLAGGLPAARSAIGNLLKGELDIDLLMVLAALAAALVGAPRDGAILLFLFSLAGTLEQYAMGSTKKAVVALMKLRPDEANKQSQSGEVARVPVESLVIDDVVVIKPGERVPVDGVVAKGASSIDQSSMTGESVPVDVAEGSVVFAGTVNGHGVLTVRVTKTASHSTLAQMITLVTEAQAKRSPSERFSDWFGARYTVVVLVGSALGLGYFFWIDLPAAEAFYKAATLLVVASPCAIVISVPAAILSALSASARRGMLFKGGAALETFAKVRVVAFDKTGTLTTGKMQVTKVEAFDIPETELLRIAASVEAHSEHPLAQSIVTYAREHNTAALHVDDAKAIPGKGMTAVIDGIQYAIGNRALLIERGVQIDDMVEQRIATLEASGNTTIVVASDVVLGVFAIADTVRVSAKQAITDLYASGITKVVMVTGDSRTVALAVARELGIKDDDVYAELLPADKVRVIEDLKKTNQVAFVGDGVNDAAALVTANVGIAMGAAGTDVALEAADVALLSDDLQMIVKARLLSQKTNTIIKQNLTFAIGILIVMVITTVFFYLPLPLGVLGHEGGTLLVVLNGLRLLLL